MNLKGFFVATLSSALELGIAKPEDLLRHATPDVLAAHLPRPLWARLLTACVGAPRVDALLVVETIGVANLCEHVPANLIWACIADIGHRALGRPTADEPILLQPKSVAPPPAPPGRNRPLTAPPPDVIARESTPAPAPAAIGPSIPGLQSLQDVVAELEADERGAIATPPVRDRVRTPTQQRFRQSNTGIGRLANSHTVRRPQAQAIAPLEQPRPRRGETEAEAVDAVEASTEVGAREDWRTALAVEDEQLVDWQASSEETLTSDDTNGHNGRKR
ncbi:MAG: hypothetical protein H0T89_18750 [Deltaproteobacteria bacterium]|nr:hypothetical protein [Deltaproteobacteria bacterium]MDQ3298957.1 hypothetical protein [Myxococcota bacterium]